MDENGALRDRNMTLGDHLEELRSRLIRALIVFGVAVAVCLAFRGKVLDIVTYPLRSALEARGAPPEVIHLGAFEGAMVVFNLCAMTGFVDYDVAVARVAADPGTGKNLPTYHTLIPIMRVS